MPQNSTPDWGNHKRYASLWRSLVGEPPGRFGKKSLKGEFWPFDLILNRLFGELIGHLDEYNRYLFGFYELSDIYVHYYYIRDDYP